MQTSPSDDLVLYKASPPSGAVGETPDQLLLHAASQGDAGWVQELLAQGATGTSRSKDSKTPLISASIRGHTAVATLLLHHGADVNAVDQDGMTALHHATLKGHVQVIELLLQNKAKLNLTCQLGRTPLHLAASGGSREAIQLLLDAGAWVGPQDELGWRPLHHAAWKGNTDVVEILLARGASPMEVDKLGRLPADVARSEDVRLLLSNAQEVRDIHKWRNLALRVVAGEACNYLLFRLAGRGVLHTPQGRYYQGWVVRHADWLRTQSVPDLRLATPKLPINCLDVARKLPGLSAQNVLKRTNIQEMVHDRCFRDGVAVFDAQMKGMHQLLAVPNVPITWRAIAGGKLIPHRILSPPPLWQPPTRMVVPGAVLKWLLIQALRRGTGHLLLSALVFAATSCPPNLLHLIRETVQEHARKVAHMAQDVSGQVVERIKGGKSEVVEQEGGLTEAEPSTSATPGISPL